MKPLKRVLITNEVGPDVLGSLHGVAEVVLGPGGGDLMPRADVLRLGPTLDGIVNQAELRVDAELLDHCPRLRVVANVAAGVENLDRALMAQRGVWATHVPDAFAEATADLTLGFILALARSMLVADRFVRSGAWTKFEPGRWDGDLLAGRTLGIVGYGRTGQAVAHRARAFGLEVKWHRRALTGESGQCPLDELLGTSDYVSLHVPLTEETRGLMNRGRFRQMKAGAYFLNLARGRTMVEADLIEALESGHLAGAALDVFEHEPAVNPRLLTLSNVLLTPHMGGGTRQSRKAARSLAVENVACVLRGERPLTPVNRPGSES